MKTKLMRSSCILAALLAVLLFAAVLAPAAHAVSATRTYFFYNDVRRDIKVTVGYEGAEPNIQFIDFSRNTYDSDESFAKVERASGVIRYYLSDAAEGNWTILSDKEITYDVETWYPELRIMYFILGTVSDNRLDIRTMVDSEAQSRYFDWYIYAQKLDDSNSVLSQQLLTSTGAWTNEDVNYTLDVSRLADAPRYRLMMEAVLSFPDGTEKSVSTESAATFSITGNTQIGDNSEIAAGLDLGSRTLSVDWSGVAVWYDTMHAIIYADNGALLLDESVSRDIMSASVSIDPAVMHSFSIELQPMDGEFYTTVYQRIVQVDPGITVNITTPEVTADMMAVIEYSAPDTPVPLTLVLNGTTGRYQLKGSGTMSLPLEPMMSNELELTFESADGTFYRFAKTIMTNTVSPVIELFGVPDGMKTDRETITVSGRTNDDAQMTVNGNAAQLGENGEFSAEVALEPGENHIEFVSENAFGIKTIRTLRVFRFGENGADIAENGAGEKKTQSRLPLLVCSGIGVFALVLASVVGMIAKRRGKNVPDRVLRALQITALVGTLIFGGAALYSHLQYNAVNKAISGANLTGILEKGAYENISEALADKATLSQRRADMLIIAGICFAALVLLIVINILMKTLGKKFKALRETAAEKKRQAAEQKAEKRAEAARRKEEKRAEAAARKAAKAKPAPARPTPAKPAPAAPVKPAAPADADEATARVRPVAGAAQPAPAQRNRFCPYCGAKVEPDARFCDSCGEKL